MGTKPSQAARDMPPDCPPHLKLTHASLGEPHNGKAIVCAVFALILFVAPVRAQTPPDPAYAPLSVGGKAVVFGKRIIAPSALAKSAFMAGVNQYQNSPEEWGQGLGGYGRRYAHKLATRGFENGIGFLVAAPLHEDPRYFSSETTGLW